MKPPNRSPPRSSAWADRATLARIVGMRVGFLAVARLSAAILWAGLALCACSDDDGGVVASEADARLAYLGLDRAVDRALALGFDGFNAATNANIPSQAQAGDVMGTMTVDGKVDKGTSDNKGMRLTVALADYSDGLPAEVDDGDEVLADIIYDTRDDALPGLNLTLRNFPSGTLTGSLLGDFDMRGDLEGTVSLELAFSGETEPTPTDAANVQRKPGTTKITGSATSPYGEFLIDLTR